jgi:PAS domain S-box-containing protein
MHNAINSPEEEDPNTELARLRYENAKLKKINNVLVRRVEMGWGNHSDAYQSFEDAAMLADKIKERTFKLQQTLHRLEESNKQLAQAKLEAEQSRLQVERNRQRLFDAIESISDALVLFDAQRRMVMVNSRCADFWRSHKIPFTLGVTTFQEITSASLVLLDRQAKAQKKVGTFPDPIAQTIFKLTDGTWIQMSERKTEEGGLVVVYTDITSIKEGEELRYEKAMAEQAQMLKATLENMSQGVALLNTQMELETWNKNFLTFAGLSEQDVQRCSNLHQLLRDSELSDIIDAVSNPDSNTPNVLFETEKTLNNGTVLLVKRHYIPGFGILISFGDITERSQHQKALQESEQRIRLITDAMPALISYVNKDMRYEFVNQGFEKWLNRPRSEIINYKLNEVLGEPEFNNLSIYIEQAMLGRTVNFEVEQHKDTGNPRISSKTFIPHFDEARNVIGFFALEQDVTEQRRTAKALKHAYDYMEQRVNQRTQKISEINEQLRKEIDERQLAQINLLAAKKEAEQANESKSKFLAATSHDLLQPMNSARLFASALSEQALGEDADKLISSLSYSLENLESLVSALVDISKLEAGLIEPVLDSFPIDELMTNMANEFAPQAQAKQLSFRSHQTRCNVYSDMYLLARILRNLLTNSIRYTHEGGILLGARRRKNGLEIQVIDTGIGIPEDKLTEIFQEFNRLDAKKRRHDQGLGLGLAIVERLASVMGHKIEVKSIEGKGSCFSITLPYANQNAISNKAPLVNRVFDQFNNHLDKAHILLIDNDEEICKGMNTLLGGWGCEVSVVQTLDELERPGFLTSLNPDLIIADYHLDNGTTGFDALDITQREITPHPPVVMITANYTNELRQQVREQGYSLLNKPVKPHKMKLILSNLLSN